MLTSVNVNIEIISPWFWVTAGYYCPAGQNVSNPFPCSPGYHCPEGSHEEVKCQAGTYQDETTQAACKDCFKGKTNPIKCIPQMRYSAEGFQLNLYNYYWLSYLCFHLHSFQ